MAKIPNPLIKSCIVCGEEFEAWGKGRSRKIICDLRECQLAYKRSQENARYRANPGPARERSRLRPTDTTYHRRYHRRYRQDHPMDPILVRSHSAVARAVKAGDLEPPEVCERCGGSPTEYADGRRGLQAHHSDYDKPLEVEWLCKQCHSLEHAEVV